MRETSHRPGGSPTVPRPRHPAVDPGELSWQQYAWWLRGELEPGCAEHNAWDCRLTGPVDSTLLAAALAGVLDANPVLRTRVRSRAGAPVAVSETAGPPLAVIDGRRLSAAAHEQWLARQLRGTAPAEADGWYAAPLRAALLRTREDEYHLGIAGHAAVCDEDSVWPLLCQLDAWYAALAGGGPPPAPPPGYPDFVRWQHAELTEHVLQERVEYWRRALAGMPEEPGRLPSVAPGGGAGRHTARLDVELCAAVRRLAGQHGVTAGTVVLAALLAVLARYHRQSDACVGIAVSDRQAAGLTAAVGDFTDLAPVRVQYPAGSTFVELLRRAGRCRAAALDARLPFPVLVSRLRPRRRPDGPPLLDIAFVERSAARPLSRSGLPVTHVRPLAYARPPVAVSVRVAADLADQMIVIDHRDGVDRDAVRRLAGHLRTALAAAAAQPEQRVADVPLLPPQEWHAVVVEPNATHATFPDTRPVHLVVAEHATRRPAATAVRFAGVGLSYGQLIDRARELSRRLAGRGVGPGCVVGVALERSPAYLVAILGALLTGAAYLPLDPAHPGDRLAFMLADAGADQLVTHPSLAGRISSAARDPVLLTAGGKLRVPAGDQDPPFVAGPVGPRDLAYVVYTSGSTGRPKGVELEHGSLTNLIASTVDFFGVAPTDRILQFAAPGFDQAVWDIFTALYPGATLCMHGREWLLATDHLVEFLRAERVTIADLPPVVIRGLPPDAFPDLRISITGMESFSADMVNRWQAPTRRFYNGYGPTEACVVMTWALCEGHYTRPPPIGRPSANMRTYVLDGELRPVPIGVPGELFIGGLGVARGYRRRPALTAERFVPDPFAGSGRRLYRTGDRCRWLPDGQLEFLGRIDEQVKIRGFRVEPGEVEQVLMSHPAVRHAVVAGWEPRAGERRLIGYLVPTMPGAVPAPAELREFLGARLPDYMIPTGYVALAALPLTSTGKLDRRALPAPDRFAPQWQPGTGTERALAGIWAALLDIAEPAGWDDFFDLGGDSALAVRLAALVRRGLGVVVPVAALFRAPTLAGYAAEVDRCARAASAT